MILKSKMISKNIQSIIVGVVLIILIYISWRVYMKYKENREKFEYDAFGNKIMYDEE
jgi:predicted negative regulator of RcsB-dependent stress response